MKIVHANNTELRITALEERAITLLSRGPMPLSAFQEGSGKWRKTSLPLDRGRRKELGILMITKADCPDHAFWQENPRHTTVIEGTALTATIRLGCLFEDCAIVETEQ